MVWTIVATIFGTIISGVLVHICIELSMERWIEPLKKFREIKRSVAIALTMYAREYTSTQKIGNLKYSEAEDVFRGLASEIRGYIETLAKYQPRVPKKSNLKDAATELIGIANMCISESITDKDLERPNVIRKKLGLISF